jgi:predicted ATPase
MIRKIESDERRPSRQIAALLADALAVDEADRDLFLQLARGRPAPDRLFQAADPSWLAPLTRRHNLPPQPNPFVGREAELAQIASRLADPNCRLLTLWGPGGIGKTCLALRAAVDHLESFPDGVFFISLEKEAKLENLPFAIAKALNIQVHSQAEPQKQVLGFLRAKKLLLVLDSFEHLIKGEGVVEEILQQAGDSKMLLTSRQSLNLEEEWLLDIDGLAYPAQNKVADLDNYPAVQLFVENARRVVSNYSISDSEKPAILDICRLVEGMPLGIKLAAGWVRYLSCKEIAAEIEHNLDFLVNPKSTGSKRHHSLRANFEHSWNLLSDDEKLIVCKLSIFHESFNRAAAERAAGGSLQSLTYLIQKSLIRTVNSLNGDAPVRYAMPNYIRQFAEEKLTKIPPEVGIRLRDKITLKAGNHFDSVLKARRGLGDKA